VGKNYADDFERRGYQVVRYALEEPYRANKDKIKECDIVFIAVPTPTTPKGFDASIVRESLSLVGENKIAVVKSTLVPGTTLAFARAFPGRTILFSPEFLSEATAAEDAAHPFANVLGIPVRDKRHEAAAAAVHAVLPRAPFALTCDSAEAELAKYAHNINGYFQIILSNLLYDLGERLGASWEPIQRFIQADPYISNRYAKPVHKSGRGAGGHCFIKDFAAFSAAYDATTGDTAGAAALAALAEKNKQLLRASGKDLDLLEAVYGPGQ
jgi:UDPglucose 6-dehydrogenase